MERDHAKTQSKVRRIQGLRQHAPFQIYINHSLFSNEKNFESEEINTGASVQENNDTEQLFDQDINEEEDFEIPAFLRKQKF